MQLSVSVGLVQLVQLSVSVELVLLVQLSVSVGLVQLVQLTVPVGPTRADTAANSARGPRHGGVMSGPPYTS